MQYQLSDRITLSVTSAADGELVEIQVLTTMPNGTLDEGKIIGRTSVAAFKPEVLISLGKALIHYANACMSKSNYRVQKLFHGLK